MQSMWNSETFPAEKAVSLPYSEFAALLRAELLQHFKQLQARLRQDLRAELQELRDMQLRQGPLEGADAFGQTGPKGPRMANVAVPAILPVPPCFAPGDDEDEEVLAPTAKMELGVPESTSIQGPPHTLLALKARGEDVPPCPVRKDSVETESSKTPGPEKTEMTAMHSVRQMRPSISTVEEVKRSATIYHRPHTLVGAKHRIPVLHPKGFFLKVYKPVIFVAILVAIVLAPFDMAYFWWKPPGAYKVFGKLLDVLFILDMVVSFNTAVLHNGHVHTDRKTIAIHYAKTYLLPDIVSNIPFDWFEGAAGGKSRKLVKLLKLPKILRFIKLLKAMQENIEHIGVSASLAALLLVGHYGACWWAWMLASECGDVSPCPPPFEAYIEAYRISVASFLTTEASSHFVKTDSGTALLALGRAYAEPLSYGMNFGSAVFNVAGLTAVGFLFANVASTLKIRSEASRIRHKMISLRKEEMALAGTPRHMRMKVLATYDHLQEYGFIKDGILRDPVLPLDLRREIAFNMYGKALRSIPIFSRIPVRFLKCLAQKVEVHFYTPGDVMMLHGEVGKQLFMILEGLARPTREDGQYLGSTVYTEGSYFGELCFLNPGSRRSASVLCIEFCRVMVLTLEAFQELNMGDVLMETFADLNGSKGSDPGVEDHQGSANGVVGLEV